MRKAFRLRYVLSKLLNEMVSLSPTLVLSVVRERFMSTDDDEGAKCAVTYTVSAICSHVLVGSYCDCDASTMPMFS